MGHAADAWAVGGTYRVAMTEATRWALLQVALWYCVIAWATWCGGTLYQMRVIVPMWSENPPQSVRDFFGRTRYPQTIRRFFGPPFMAARGLPVALAFGLAWGFPQHQLALSIALGCVVAAIVHTKLLIYPINTELIDRAGEDLNVTQIRTMTRAWITHDQVRFAVGCTAFAALLWAFQLPNPLADEQPRGPARADSRIEPRAPTAMSGCIDPAEAFLFLGGNDLQRLQSQGLICGS